MSAAPLFGSSPIPVIDIAPSRNAGASGKTAVARQIDEACRNIGFLVIRGHGVDPNLIARMQAVTNAFFALPEAAKRACEAPSPEIYRGYTALATSALALTSGDTHTAADYREGFTVNRHRIDPADPYYASPMGKTLFSPNIYPAELPEMQAVMEKWYDEMTGLATHLMGLFALALGLEEHFFDRFVDKHMTNLMLSNYPDQVTPPLPGQLRAGAHTDYGSMTILLTEDKPGGLEVMSHAGEWLPVPIVPDSFIINIGDLMAQWTNDRWISTMHRVVNPPQDAQGSTQRQSIIFFHQPNYDALIECLPSCVDAGAKYSPTTSGEHLLMKMRQAAEIL